MAIRYASEQIAKNVTRQLRAVAAELKQDEELHLPDFLDVDPHAEYAEWKKNLDQKRVKVKNAPEGTANEQEKLCQTLAKEFKTEKEWRGLLNRLGQMQIEPAIGGLARRKPSPEVVRSAFATHLHTLQFVVGAPDADKIVEDLFSAKNIVIPDEPEEEEENEPPTHALSAESEDDSAELEPEDDSGGGFWDKLGGALLEALGEHLDRKVNENNQRVEIAGQWYSQAGDVFTFFQMGLAVRVEGVAWGVPLSAQGQIVGKSLELDGFSQMNGPFHASLVVSPDGNTITGQLFDSFGRGSAAYLYR